MATPTTGSMTTAGRTRERPSRFAAVDYHSHHEITRASSRPCSSSCPSPSVQPVALDAGTSSNSRARALRPDRARTRTTTTSWTSTRTISRRCAPAGEPQRRARESRRPNARGEWMRSAGRRLRLFASRRARRVLRARALESALALAEERADDQTTCACR